MKILCAYLLAYLGGNESPSVQDVEEVIKAAGAQADVSEIVGIVDALKGKNIFETIECGNNLLAKVPFSLEALPEDKFAKFVPYVPSMANDWVRGFPFIADRSIAVMVLDKQLYKPTDKIHYKIIAFNALTFLPVMVGYEGCIAVTLKNATGANVVSDTPSVGGYVLYGSLDLPSNVAGGEYTVEYRGAVNIIGAERKITIRAFSNPRVKGQIQFAKQGYQPSDTVNAWASIRRADETSLSVENTTVTAIARVGGNEVYRATVPIERGGEVRVSFQLPSRIDKEEGSLSLLVKEFSEVDSISKTIPIVLQSVDIEFFASSGDLLLVGVENIIAFEVTSPATKQYVDIEAEVVCGTTVVGTTKTEHEGRGKFRLTPNSEKDQFALRIVNPSSMAGKEYRIKNLKCVSKDAVLMEPVNRVFTAGQDSVKFKISILPSTDKKPYYLKIFKKERLLNYQLIGANKTNAPITKEITVGGSSFGLWKGVLTATLFTDFMIPIQEVLLFAKPRMSGLDIKVIPNKLSYCPGEQVTLTFHTTQEGSSVPVDGNLGVCVTDDSVHQMTESRLRSPQLPALLYLEKEVKDLADSNIYLSSTQQERAVVALDLLLSTQGWRKFIYYQDRSTILNATDAVKKLQALALSSNVANSMSEPVISYACRAARSEQKKEEYEEDEEDFSYGGLFDDEGGGEGMSFSASSSYSKPSSSASSIINVAKVFASSNRSHSESVKSLDARSNFRDTIYWAPVMRTLNGECTCSFKLNDSISSFRVLVDGFTDTGLIGFDDSLVIQSIKPFYAEMKLPAQFSYYDKVKIPLTLVNNSPTTQEASFEAVLQAPGVSDVPLIKKSGYKLTPHSKKTEYLEFAVGTAPSLAITVNAESSPLLSNESVTPYKDKLYRTATVAAVGVKQTQTFAGKFFNERKEITFSIPPTIESVSGNFQVYLVTASVLIQAMKSLIKMPYGCFEQTSSTLYPMVMAAQYFQLHPNLVDHKTTSMVQQHLQSGYNKLLTYQCVEGGFTWFGFGKGSPPLTAYGIMEFSDMSSVFNVCKHMVSRHTEWLLMQVDPSGAFSTKSTGYDGLSNGPLHTTTAYITWALICAGVSASELRKCIDWCSDREKTFDKDFYFQSLLAIILAKDKQESKAAAIADYLKAKQNPDGSLTAGSTMTNSSGRSAVIETTSLAVLAWLQVSALQSRLKSQYDAPLVDATMFLRTCCQGGQFGTTQSTVLALKAILAYEQSDKQPTGFCEVQLDGEQVFHVNMADSSNLTAELPFSERNAVGDHKLVLNASGLSTGVPYSITVDYIDREPTVHPEELRERMMLNFDVSLTNNSIVQGESTEIRVLLQELSTGRGMVVAIIGIPSGLEPRLEKLQQLMKAEKIAFYEIVESKLILYWTHLAPKQTVELLIDAVAMVPGEFSGDCCCAYTYYDDEVKFWTKGQHVKIQQ